MFHIEAHQKQMSCCVGHDLQCHFIFASTGYDAILFFYLLLPFNTTHSDPIGTMTTPTVISQMVDKLPMI